MHKKLISETGFFLLKSECAAVVGGGGSAEGWAAVGEIAGGLVGGAAGVLFGGVGVSYAAET